MNVLMVGVDESTKGGMWTVVENYLQDEEFVKRNNLIYIPTSITGSIIKKLGFTFKAYLEIYKNLKKRHTDIVHVHMSERGSVYRKGIVLKMAKKFRAKTIIHMHGAEFEVWYKALPITKQKKVRDILNGADKILILGNYWNEFISSLLTNPEKIEVVYNAVYVPKTNHYSSSAKQILFLGAVSQRKGIYDFLDALKIAAADISSDYQVSVYGPDVIGNVAEEIEKRELGTWVKYCGWLSADNKKKVLSDTSINVLPSYNEGLPMTILETMSYGIPSITTNVAAIPEAVNNENGILIEPGDVNTLAESLVQLCTDNEERLRKSKNAYLTMVNKFSLEKHINNINKVYEEI